MASLPLKTACKIDRLFYKYRLFPINSKEYAPFHKIIHSLSFVYPNWHTDFRLLYKDIKRVIQTRYRWKKRLTKMVDHFGKLYLVTLTFTDDVLSSTNSVSRRKYVLNWANEHCLDYIGCIDFGKKNNREHYHLIVALDVPMTRSFYGHKMFFEFDSLLKWKDAYGFASCRDCYGCNYKQSLSYAFKSCFYALKSADKSHKPFSKRGIKHFSPSAFTEEFPDSVLPYCPYLDEWQPYLYVNIDECDLSMF